MRPLGKIIGHIPARGGSKRVPAKNLRKLCGRPMIAYAIDCAKKCGIFDAIYVNTDSEELAALAEASDVHAYRRKAHLASDTATGDDFTADFIEKVRPDTLVMINPVCPLIEPSDVMHAIEVFRNSDCDTLIACEETQMQVFCEGEAMNIDATAPLAPSQKNRVVKILNWAVTIWETRVFLENYHRTKSGYLGTRRELLAISPARCLKVSHEEDFCLAETMIRARDDLGVEAAKPSYWNPGDPV